MESALQSLLEGLIQYMGYMGREWGIVGLKTMLKNTCEGVYFLEKLLAISLQPCKFAKNKLLHTYFSGILARFKFLFIAF